MSTASLETQLEHFRENFQALRTSLAESIVGQAAAVDAVLTALVAGGHVLLGGGPGCGKTRLAHALAEATGLSFRRIQCTSDLMPSDITGTYVVLESQGQRKFEFQPGPIFAQFVLADEINRCSPKTQGALLEGLEEHAVTVFNRSYPLPKPFFVLATQGSADAAGTFPLPETQLDRFLMHVELQFPDLDDMDAIVTRSLEPAGAAAPGLRADTLLAMTELARQVTIAPEVLRCASEWVLAMQPAHRLATARVRKYVERGGSPRGAQGLVWAAQVRAILDDRVSVARADLAAMAVPVLRHRMALNYEGLAEGVSPVDLVEEVLANSV
jgi:MoxR-like ATPase